MSQMNIPIELDRELQPRAEEIDNIGSDLMLPSPSRPSGGPLSEQTPQRGLRRRHPTSQFPRSFLR